MKNSSAFTLIELLVVVLIIGILAAVALPQYQKAVEKTRAVEAALVIKTLTAASSVYYLANGSYTDMSLENLDVDIKAQTLQNFDLHLGGSRIYSPTHADIYMPRRGKPYFLTGVLRDGKLSRRYCQTSSDEYVEICKALGASNCTKNTQCGF